MTPEFKEWCIEQENRWREIANILKNSNATEESIKRALSMAEMLSKLAM